LDVQGRETDNRLCPVLASCRSRMLLTHGNAPIEGFMYSNCSLKKADRDSSACAWPAVTASEDPPVRKEQKTVQSVELIETFWMILVPTM
jgi:hypothetical protein